MDEPVTRAEPSHELDNPVVERVQGTLADAHRGGEAIGLLLVHSAAIDRIDALHGFHAGDRMSASIVHLLRTKAVRKRDLVEPLSRDEFACVLRPAPSEGIAMLAANRVMTLLGNPMEFGGRSVAPDAAVGIAMFPRPARDAGELLQQAKHAMHEARGVRDRICLYVRPAGDAAVIDQLDYESRLRSAIEQNNLTLYFQPQLDIRTGRISGAEALLRRHDEVLAPVRPDRAVKAAETAGVMDQLSPSNLREADLPFYVDRALRTWRVSGTSIVIEITETAMMLDPSMSHEALLQLKALGVKLSVDDFGTGYSSMQYLAQLPLDELKIDLSFVMAMLEQPQNAKIVRSLIDLAHNLELKVVAEGIESAEILAALEHLGCDIGQGYHIGKPMPAAELARRLTEQ